MLEKTSAPDNQLSKEDYLIMRAKEALPVDIYAAKSWLITARSLFPHSAKVQVSSGLLRVHNEFVFCLLCPYIIELMDLKVIFSSPSQADQILPENIT